MGDLPAPWRSSRARRAFAVVFALAALVFVVHRAVRIDFPSRTAPAVSVRLAKAEREKRIVERADELLAQYVAVSRFSGVVLIAFGDEVRLERSFGVAGPETHLTFGSLPKQFTGYLIHRLAERGVLGLDQRVDEIVPELRDAPAGSVTLRQLLHMTSGLPGSVDPVTNVRLQLSSEWMSEASLLEKIRGYRLAFPPGSDYLYSNVGYRLLAVVATRSAHRDWPSLLRDEVLAPAAMIGAGLFEPGGTVPPDLPPGHLPYRCALLAGAPCMLRLPHWNYSALWGAGAVYARARDLLAWGRFLARLARDEPDFFAGYTATDREDYGSGIENIEVTTPDGERVRVYSHGGEDPGYAGYFAWVPSLDATIVWISNSDYAITSDYALGRELRGLVVGLPYAVCEPP